MAITPKNLLKRNKLPLAAHLHTPTAPPGLDLSRPLLLYNTYTSTKVRIQYFYIYYHLPFPLLPSMLDLMKEYPICSGFYVEGNDVDV